MTYIQFAYATVIMDLFRLYKKDCLFNSVKLDQSSSLNLELKVIEYLNCSKQY